MKNYRKDFETYQFQETIFFNQPGTKLHDNINNEAITFCDMEGHKATYSWEKSIPKKFDQPEYQPIQLVNFKSEYRPFSIYDPKRITRPFSFGFMSEYSTFPSWNLWSVQQAPSDGRNLVVPDKSSHSSLTESNGRIQIFEKGPNNSYLASSIIGMTTNSIVTLIPLAKSWIYPALLNSDSPEFISKGYDKFQRSYVLKANNPKAKELRLRVNASMTSPLQNLALVIENWDAGNPRIKLNGKSLKEPENYSIGRITGLDANKTVLFIRIESSNNIELTIQQNYNDRN